MTQRLTLDQSATYRIEVQGTIGSQWTDYLGGLKISVNRERDPPVSVLRGRVMDHAALLGILNSLYDLGFPLLSVEYESSP